MTRTAPLPRLDTDGFASPETIEVDVILTFDDGPQAFYDTEVIADIATTDLDATEIDVVSQILDDARRDLSDLVKISLCFNTAPVQDPQRQERRMALIDHLCRFSAKWYFQPDQRDPHEQAIVDALGIASRTAPVSKAVA